MEFSRQSAVGSRQCKRARDTSRLQAVSERYGRRKCFDIPSTLVRGRSRTQRLPAAHEPVWGLGDGTSRQAGGRGGGPPMRLKG